jgi:hypothetical protein
MSHHGHDHEHGHDHGHSHDTPTGDMTQKQEFQLRLTRWRDHNREHQQSLAEWEKKIADAGYASAAAAMRKAADALAVSVAELDKALETLK